MNNFLDDNPIASDEPKKDAFTRNAYAKKIAESILSKDHKDINVYSIEGSWGCGKTSLMNMVKSDVESINDKTIVIDFKPWHFNKDIAVQDKLIEVLHAHFKTESNLANLLVEYTFSLGATGLSLATLTNPKFAIIKSGLEGMHKLYKKYATKTPEEIKKQINSELDKRISPIVIFIDDLDRLAGEEVLDVLKLVREVANFKNVKYVLAYDRNYVDQIITEAKFPNPYQYINKIINFTYPVPKITDEQYQDYFNNHLQKILSSYPVIYIDDDFQMVLNYRVKPLLTTPREIKALINRVSFVCANLKSEFKLSEIIQLEAIFLSSPQLYEHIKSHPEAYIGFDINRPFPTEDPKKIVSGYDSERMQIIDSGNPKSSKKKTLNNILSDLFPHTSSYKSTSLKGGYVNTRDGFAKYFNYSIPSNLVSKDDIEHFFDNNFNQNILDKYIDQGELLSNLMSNVLSMIETGQKHIGILKDNILDNLSNLFNDSYLSEFEMTKQSFLNRGPLNIAWRLILKYFQSNPDKIDLFIFDKINKGASIYLILELHDRFRKTLKEETVEKVKSYLQHSLNTANILKQYIDNHVFMRALEGFKIADLDVFKQNISHVNLVKFFECITSQGMDSKGWYVEPPGIKVNQFFNADWLATKAEESNSFFDKLKPIEKAIITAIKTRKKIYSYEFKSS